MPAGLRVVSPAEAALINNVYDGIIVHTQKSITFAASTGSSAVEQVFTGPTGAQAGDFVLQITNPKATTAANPLGPARITSTGGIGIVLQGLTAAFTPTSAQLFDIFLLRKL